MNQAALAAPASFGRVEFGRQGYLGPVRVFSSGQCGWLASSLRAAAQEPPLDWNKGSAATSRLFYEIGTHGAILERAAHLLGRHVMLWGAYIVKRRPGAVHPWHTDIESSETHGKAVSVWIGLENTDASSSLLVVPYSHRFGVTVQEMAHHAGLQRDAIRDQDVERWACERNPQSSVINPGPTDGEALFFDGRLWHGSNNQSPDRPRVALLLQFATPDTAIRIPDPAGYEWPFRRLSVPRPPCLLVRGSDHSAVNRWVSAPVPADRKARMRLGSWVQQLEFPLRADAQRGWQPYPVFRGSTSDLRDLECHVSVLEHGRCPHPPHQHPEEEILIVLAGEVDIVLPQWPPGERGERHRLQPGQFAYYPAQFPHTLETVSESPAHYLMLRWRADDSRAKQPLAAGIFSTRHDPSAARLGRNEGFDMRLLTEGATLWLRKLQIHVSTVAPGAGYAPHVDAYDVVILVLEGEIETLGERIGPNAVVFSAAGEAHGLRNPGRTAARYVVFEFHGGQRALWTRMATAAAQSASGAQRANSS